MPSSDQVIRFLICLVKTQQANLKRFQTISMRTLELEQLVKAKPFKSGSMVSDRSATKDDELNLNNNCPQLPSTNTEETTFVD